MLLGMSRAQTPERLGATILAAGTGIAAIVDVVHIVTFQGRGSPDIASILLLVVIAALHVGLIGVNGGLAALLGRRQPRGVARVIIWGWLGLSGIVVLLLAAFAAILAT